MSYKDGEQHKNLAWFLPRPKPDHYKGGMPLHCEKWLVELAVDIFDDPKITFEKIRILNLFCGMNAYGYRVDVNPEVEPDLLCDAHDFVDKLPKRKREFDLVIADPPYSNEEAKEIYGTGKLKYKQWTAEVAKVVRPGGLFIVYHKYVMPNPDPEKFFVVKRVFIGSRAYHLPRVAIYFQRK